MKTKTIELYEFSELSEEAKQRVLDDNRYINVDHLFWYEYETSDEAIIETIEINEYTFTASGKMENS